MICRLRRAWARVHPYQAIVIEPVPTLLSLLWQPALSPWAVHASNQSETFVEIPPGSTYSTYPTGTASTLKKLEQRAERLPHQSLGGMLAPSTCRDKPSRGTCHRPLTDIRLFG
ncbi:hypothetical protein JOQ06_018717, partial [Pogonophryne albipinna]